MHRPTSQPLELEHTRPQTSVQPRTTNDPQAVLRAVAAQFGEPALSTILFENWFKHLHELQLIRAHLPETGTLTDVGGGLGVNLICLRRLGHRGKLVLLDRFVEYDDGNRMGSHERARATLRDHDVEVQETEFWPNLEIPFAADTCDVVTSFDVIEHLPGNPLQHLAEIRRVLQQDGHTILGAPNASSLMKRVDLALRGRHPYAHFEDWMRSPYYEHYREYTPGEYREILRRSGFQVTQQMMSSAVPRSRARSRYHNGHHSWLSPVPYALFGIAALEGLMANLRHTVYTIGLKTN
jgi:SAM-dependent methyltransferase